VGCDGGGAEERVRPGWSKGSLREDLLGRQPIMWWRREEWCWIEVVMVEAGGRHQACAKPPSAALGRPSYLNQLRKTLHNSL